MLETTIQTLADNRPPRTVWKFTNARAAHNRITEMEALLALPGSPFNGNIAAANRRVSELETIATERSQAQAAIAAAQKVVAATPSSALEPKPALFGYARAAAGTRIEAMKRPNLKGTKLTGAARMAAAMTVEGKKN